MSIRKEALDSKAFQALKDVYDNREKVLLEQKEKGKIIVGELGCDVPDELLLAADMFPVHVYADPAKPLVETDRYLEYAFDPIVRAQFEKIVDGTYGDLIDYLVVSNSTDVIIRIYLYLREMHRQGIGKDLPPVEFIDWMFTRNRMHQVRNEDTIKIFWKAVESWAGKTITGEAVKKAAAICNENRQALRKMAELRHGEEVHINGSEALVIIGAAFFMNREEHTKLVKAVTEDAAGWPVIDGPRIYFTGSGQEDTSFYDMIEDTGAVIISEDHDWGDRYFERDYNMDYTPVRAIVDRYMLREFSSKKAFVSQRVEALDREVAESKAEAVIFATNKYEEAASWDYPSQKASLDEKGIPAASFVQLQYPIDKNEGLKEKIADFVNSLKGGDQ